MDRGVPARAAWLVAPVLLAGLAHVVILKSGSMRRLAVPLDAGLHWHGGPIFGANKTWRGPVVMTLGTALATLLQGTLWRRPDTFRSRNQGLSGALIGLTYSIAELPNSFVKRRLGVPPGERSHTLRLLQSFVDEADSVVGCLIVARFLYRPSDPDLAAAFVLGLAAHGGVDLMMHAMGLKRSQ